MDKIARWNYQHNKPEDFHTPATTYTSENSIDRWVMSRNKIRNSFHSKDFLLPTDDITKEIINQIQKTINDHFH